MIMNAEKQKNALKSAKNVLLLVSIALHHAKKMIKQKVLRLATIVSLHVITAFKHAKIVYIHLNFSNNSLKMAPLKKLNIKSYFITVP